MNIFKILLLNFALASVSYAGRIGLIVSVNGVSFTTRQVKLYINFREALRDQSKVGIVGEAQFEDALKVFVEEMVVLQEQQRMSGYQVPKEAMEAAVKKLDGRRSLPGEFAGFWQTSAPSPAEVKRFLSEILSVAYYRQTRSRRVTEGSNKEIENSWIKPLMERAIIRYYDKV